MIFVRIVGMNKESIKLAIHHKIKQHSIYEPIYSKDLESMFAISGVAIREAVHTLRSEDNIPICSGRDGYFYPQSKAEANHTINQLKSRAKQCFEAAKGIEEHYIKDNQITLL